MWQLGRFVDSQKPSPYYLRLLVALRRAQGPEPGRGTKLVCLVYRVCLVRGCQLI